MLTKRANGWGAFLGAVTGITAVTLISIFTPVSFHWYGVSSATVAFATGYIYSFFFNDSRTSEELAAEDVPNDLERIGDPDNAD